MQWDVVLGAIGGVGAIIIAVTLFLKHGFERLLDLKLKEAENRNKILLTELTRRQAALFDLQLSPLSSLLSHLYRLRNIAREFKDAKTPSHQLELAERTKRCANDVQSLLVDYRAVLPSAVFSVAHSAKGSARMISETLIAEKVDFHTEGKHTHLIDRDALQAYLEDIEELYDSLTKLVHEHLDLK